MVPAWIRYVSLGTLLVGWAAVITTMVLMIRAKRAQRLAAEALQAEQERLAGQAAPAEAVPQP